VNSIMQEKQFVSKKRVADHGEVYTGNREVDSMLDLVRQETERIDSRFLEPACGNGNFLVEVLQRKLGVVEKRYRKSQLEYERKSFIAISSIYGIEILEDNVIQCRKRLFDIFNERYVRLFKKASREQFRNVVKFVLGRNIIWGNALNLKTAGDMSQPIVFSEWSAPFNNSMIKRRDFTFSDLIQSDRSSQQDLFSEPQLVSDLGEKAFIPREKPSFSPIHFLKIGEVYE